MSFLHPEYFYYMILPLLLIFGFLLTKKESQEHFFAKEVIEKLRVGVNSLTLKTRNILFLLIVILLVVSLAEPVIKDGTVEVKSKSADIMIALDISDSMLAEDVYPNRLRLAKEKAISLLKIAPHERIGVVGFARNSYLVSPMSFDHAAVEFLLSKLNTDSITEQGTDLMALLNVVNTSIKKEGKKHLLIFTDGGDKEDFSEEIEFAKDSNIVVYIIGIGTTKGAPIKNKDGSFIKYKGEIIVSSLNENISKLATGSGGVYIESIKSDDDVKAMLQEIDKASIKKELQVEEVQKFIPLFYYPLGLAIVFLLIATSSLGRKVNTGSMLIILSVLVLSPDSKAGLLDFMDLKEAKKAYEVADYNKSANIYDKYAGDTNNSESYYNKGNSLYKQEKFDEALKAYDQAKFDDNISQAKTQANIGNTHVKQAKQDSLQKAAQAYEESLKYNEDKDVRENLEAVKKEIQKQKEDKQQDKPDQNEKDKPDQNKQDNKDSKDSDKSEKKDNKNKDSKDKKSNDMKNKDEKEKEDKSQEQKKREEQEKNEQEKKDNLDKLDKEKSQSKEQEEASSMQNEGEMSDAEEEKWLNKLNAEQSTYMYMLHDNDKSKEEHADEKPW